MPDVVGSSENDVRHGAAGGREGDKGAARGEELLEAVVGDEGTSGARDMYGEVSEDLSGLRVYFGGWF